MPDFLRTFDAAAVACIHESRPRLARALWVARKLPADQYRRIVSHANYIGWPIRLRPNGRYC